MRRWATRVRGRASRPTRPTSGADDLESEHGPAFQVVVAVLRVLVTQRPDGGCVAGFARLEQPPLDVEPQPGQP